MARKSKPIEPLTRKQISRREREAQQRRILYTVAAVTALAVLLVLGYGFYQEYVVKPAAPVAVVNGKPISTKDYQAMVRYRRFELASMMARVQNQLSLLDPTAEEQQFLVQYFQQQLQQLQLRQMNLPMDVLDSMIDDELIRQEAARRNITVTPEEVQEEIELQFGYQRNPPTPTPTPITATVAITLTPTPTEAPMTLEEFQRNYSEYVIAMRKNAGISEATFRRLFESNIYRRKLQEALAAEVPSTAEQIHARHILVDTEEEAQKVKERLQAGEDFAALAKELSKDTASASEGGDLGWFPRGMMVTEFEEAAFALEPGQTSDIVKTIYGYHIIQLIERDPNRPLDEDFLAQKKASALDDWLAEQRQSDAVKRYWSSEKVPPTK
ncbi:MAG: peptidylprolyl isomerase [Candidatus Hadarchaeum sp.]